jgi:hypothetical protein
VSSGQLREVREIIRDEHVMRRPILAALAGGPLTIPQLSEAIGQPSREVVFWVMALRKYGKLREIGPADDEGYFTYEAVPQEA